MLANLLHSVVPAFVVLSQDLGPLGACLGIFPGLPQEGRKLPLS
jgi:hypothetical protein